MQFPQFAVSYWIGHSITVSGKHYANNVPDELFRRASARTAMPTKSGALQKAMQQAAALACTAMKSSTNGHSKNEQTREDFASLQECATSCNEQEQWSRGDSNPRV
jgi:hypothetical protein